jgi:hypothetical protein
MDVIVAVWESETSERYLLGYQLKEGKKKMSKVGNVVFVGCWAIRGDVSKKARKSRNWQPFNERDAREFFGLSGSRWTPQEWKRLVETKKFTKKD